MNTNTNTNTSNSTSGAMVFWASRHLMTDVQLLDLIATIDGEVTVISQNLTYPAESGQALAEITAAAQECGCTVIAGVFPAHVAAAVARRSATAPEEGWPEWRHGYQGIHWIVPVSVPAPAKEGETRGGGFVHSHWEWLTKGY